MPSAFEIILMNTTQGVALLDANLRVLFGNDRLSELLQIPRLSVGVDATTIAEQMRDFDESKLWLSHLLTETTSLHREITIGDGLVYLASLPVGDGQWLIQCEDISALARARKELSDQGSLFDTALDNLPHGLCMFDADKNLMLCNAAYARSVQPALAADPVGNAPSANP